jgi:hypothetical protein
MAARLSLFVPRLVVLTLIALLATATLTFAAGNRPAATTPRAAPAPRAPAVLVVPDVRGQVYVFAKGTLEEAGFAWRITGGVAGYPANRVAFQSPAPGLRVLDTGAPTISLSLNVNRGYPQQGVPENASPFPGTAVRLADANVVAVPRAKPTKQAAPRRKAAVEPKAMRKRPPAFVVPGGRAEPQHEVALPDRAGRLAVWLSSHRELSDANVRYWLYQHAWIVVGARLGWWRGAEALETLIRVDERVQVLWGIGAKSEAVARAALAEVRAKGR